MRRRAAQTSELESSFWKPPRCRLAKMNDAHIFMQTPTATDRRLAPGAVKALPVSAYYCLPVSLS
jgi:hypothetical protein